MPSSPPLPPPAALLRPVEAAAMLGLKPATLAKWRVLGIGPRFTRVGDGVVARVAYRREHIEAWLAERSGFRSTTEADAAACDRAA